MGNKTIHIYQPKENEKKLFYSGNNEKIEEACIGHLRIDFGFGKEFRHSWWQHNGETENKLNTQPFKETLDRVIDSFRKNLLKNREYMGVFLSQLPTIQLDSYQGFKAECDGYVFFIRCDPAPGTYNCFCYCYDKALLEQAMTEQENNNDIDIGGM